MTLYDWGTLECKAWFLMNWAASLQPSMLSNKTGDVWSQEELEKSQISHHRIQLNQCKKTSPTVSKYPRDLVLEPKEGQIPTGLFVYLPGALREADFNLEDISPTVKLW